METWRLWACPECGDVASGIQYPNIHDPRCFPRLETERKTSCTGSLREARYCCYSKFDNDALYCLVMTEESTLSTFSARVANTVTDTILLVTPDFVWDSWAHDIVQYLSKELSNADFHYQILVALITWFLVNLFLIKVAWSIFGEDNTKLLSSVDHIRHLKKE